MTATASRTNRTRSFRLAAIDERTRRVLQLRELVRDGRYVVDPAEVAAAMLAEWFVASRETDPPPIESALSRFVVPRSECGPSNGRESARTA